MRWGCDFESPMIAIVMMMVMVMPAMMMLMMMVVMMIIMTIRLDGKMTIAGCRGWGT